MLNALKELVHGLVPALGTIGALVYTIAVSPLALLTIVVFLPITLNSVREKRPLMLFASLFGSSAVLVIYLGPLIALLLLL